MDSGTKSGSQSNGTGNSQQSAALKVLVAEDDRVCRHLVTSVLAREGYDVTEVPDGEEAKAVASDDYSLAIVDLKMPRADGFDLMEYLTENHPSIEIVVVSSGDIEDAVKAMKEGAFWFVPKPIETDKLVSVVKQALKGSGSQTRRTTGLSLQELERRAIIETLKLCGGNRAKAAKKLGISERSIYNKLKRYGISDA